MRLTEEFAGIPKGTEGMITEVNETEGTYAVNTNLGSEWVKESMLSNRGRFSGSKNKVSKKTTKVVTPKEDKKQYIVTYTDTDSSYNYTLATGEAKLTETLIALGQRSDVDNVETYIVSKLKVELKTVITFK